MPCAYPEWLVRDQDGSNYLEMLNKISYRGKLVSAPRQNDLVDRQKIVGPVLSNERVVPGVSEIFDC